MAKIDCKECGQNKEHHAKDMCKKCYNKQYNNNPINSKISKKESRMYKDHYVRKLSVKKRTRRRLEYNLNATRILELFIKRYLPDKQFLPGEIQCINKLNKEIIDWVKIGSKRRFYLPNYK